jgi:hypothetical protein
VYVLCYPLLPTGMPTFYSPKEHLNDGLKEGQTVLDQSNLGRVSGIGAGNAMSAASIMTFSDMDMVRKQSCSFF